MLDRVFFSLIAEKMITSCCVLCEVLRIMERMSVESGSWRFQAEGYWKDKAALRLLKCANFCTGNEFFLWKNGKGRVTFRQ